MTPRFSQRNIIQGITERLGMEILPRIHTRHRDAEHPCRVKCQYMTDKIMPQAGASSADNVPKSWWRGAGAWNGSQTEELAHPRESEFPTHLLMCLCGGLEKMVPKLAQGLFCWFLVHKTACVHITGNTVSISETPHGSDTPGVWEPVDWVQEAESAGNEIFLYGWCGSAAPSSEEQGIPLLQWAGFIFWTEKKESRVDGMVGGAICGGGCFPTVAGVASKVRQRVLSQQHNPFAPAVAQP